MHYSKQQSDWMRGHVELTYADTICEFEKAFGIRLERKNIKSWRSNHHCFGHQTGRFEKGNVPVNKGKHQPTTGRMAETQYKKGHIAANNVPIGSRTRRSDGYWYIKIQDGHNTKNWKSEAIVIWEKLHGHIPDGYRVVFIDGNKNNLDPDNLRLMSEAAMLQLNRWFHMSGDADLNNVKLSVAELMAKTYERKRND